MSDNVTKVGGSDSDWSRPVVARVRVPVPTKAELDAAYERIQREVRDNLVRRAQAGCEEAREQIWACW